jgi:hypothetical protein
MRKDQTFFAFLAAAPSGDDLAESRKILASGQTQLVNGAPYPLQDLQAGPNNVPRTFDFNCTEKHCQEYDQKNRRLRYLPAKTSSIALWNRLYGLAP